MIRFKAPLALLGLVACGGGNGGGGGGGVADPCGRSTSTAFEIVVRTVEIDERKPDGRAWDTDGSYADPYVCIGSESSSWTYACSETQTNRTQATFNASHSGIAVQDVFIDVWDEDLIDDDYIGGIVFGLQDLRDLADCGLLRIEGTSSSGLGLVTFEVSTL